MTEVKCDCSYQFTTNAQTVTTCRNCGKKIRVNTHQVLQKTTKTLRKTTQKLHAFKEEFVTIPKSWIPIIVYGLSTHLSAHKSKFRDHKPSGIIYHQLEEIIQKLIGYDQLEVRKMLDKLEIELFKLDM